MPPGGDGLYYFYAHFRVLNPKFAQFFMRRNGWVFCVIWEDERDGNDSPASSCGAVVTLVEDSVFFSFNLFPKYPFFQVDYQLLTTSDVCAMFRNLGRSMRHLPIFRRSSWIPNQLPFSTYKQFNFCERELYLFFFRRCCRSFLRQRH